MLVDLSIRYLPFHEFRLLEKQTSPFFTIKMYENDTLNKTDDTFYTASRFFDYVS